MGRKVELKKYAQYFGKNREDFLKFLCKTRKILREIRQKGGDLDKVFRILNLIREEEYIQQHFQILGVRIPYPWELREKEPYLVGETKMRVYEINLEKKRKRKKYLSPEDAPKELKSISRYVDETLTKLLGAIKSFEEIKEVGASFDVEFVIGNKLYILDFTFLDYSKALPICKETHKGRKGEPLANVSMYLLYKYFKQLGIKNIYEKIATLVGEFSSFLFKNKRGVFLEPDMVRKRIQWVKKRKEVLNYAQEVEKSLKESLQIIN